ncbi:acyltransferase [Paenibacillus sp. Mc5Re-14]|uniref:acyltransferase n=1 Tax=Paenibacillus sp. Mc5Re-14 TaxID=1030529 RepID=UPI000A601337|nr:acyltransferase [Paenibacillus sp. Mc5Re-14]
MVKKERIPELDIYRGILIAAVITIHATSMALIDARHSLLFYPFLFLNMFSSFAVPVFIFVSGFVLFYNYVDRPLRGKSMLLFFRKRLMFIVLPYVLFSLMYYLTLVTRGLMPLSDLPLVLLTGKAYTHLYYVIIIIQFYLAFPLLLWGVQRLRHWISSPRRAAFVILAVGLVIQWGFVLLNKYVWQEERGSLAITYISYFALGAAVAIGYEGFKKWLFPVPGTVMGRGQLISWWALWAAWLLLGIVYVQIWFVAYRKAIYADSLVYELLHNAYALVSALVLFQLSVLLYRHTSDRLRMFISWLGACSFGIYLLHPALLRVYRKLDLHGTPIEYVFSVAGGWVLALFGSWLIVTLFFRYVPFSWIGLGTVPKFPFQSKDKKANC